MSDIVIDRPSYRASIQNAFRIHPVVALLGPRQCGKTTLARQISEGYNMPDSNYFDLERMNDLVRLQDAELTLSKLDGLVVIDEIQRRPELFQILRVLVDRKDKELQFLVLGSASRDLIHQSSETLAGRIHYIELKPFSSQEVPDFDKLWQRGGFPQSYLAEDDALSALWRESFVQAFLERDIPALGFDIQSMNMRRFWAMLCHYHGQVCNYSELGRSLGMARKTIAGYLDLLTETYMVRQLQPWFANIGKRQVKSPKIYIRDSGILHTLLDIETKDALFRNPKLGASWEGFAVEEVIRKSGARADMCYFWGTHAHAELDLLIVKDEQKLGFEFKYTDQPRTTKSMHIAMQDLGLERLMVVYPGEHSFPLTESIQAIGIASVHQLNFL